jgi:hypothetical protein
MGKSRRLPWKGSLIFSGLVLLATVAVMVFVPTEQVLLEVGVLIAGLLAGSRLVRFGVPRRWIGSLVLVLFLVVWLALGTAGYAWFGGFLAGTCAGVAWGRAVENRTASAAAPWIVDEQGFDTVAEARAAADAALSALDGNTRGRLTVEHGSARLEVVGSTSSGLVCHRNSEAADEGSWAVLVRPGQVTEESVEVPMGDAKGFIPSRWVNDPAHVEAALADFFKNPRALSFGPEWMTGGDAGATRLSTY